MPPLAYRQARFYQQTAEGWQRTIPQAELWGSPDHLESSHFIFHFRRQDAQVVAAVAPQMDALYAELQRNFGLTPSLDKLVIEVRVETLTVATAAPSWSNEPFVVPSPALYLAPAELSDNEILAQSIAVPLIDYMARRLIEEHKILSHWQPLRAGLELWQLWDLEMPLSQWRDEIVTWLYVEVPANGPEWHSTQPDTYQNLCTIHRLWMLSPMLIGIPLKCFPWEEGGQARMHMLAHRPIMHLDELTTPLTEYVTYDDEIYFSRSTQAVAVATLLEYAVATYGYEQLPILLAGLAHYEEGWRSYLLAHYR